jgi:peptidyl-tRNA hydrolase
MKGIGRPPGKMDPASFVLRKFTAAEREEVHTHILILFQSFLAFKLAFLSIP